MEDGLPPGLIKKLALVGVFLVAVSDAGGARRGSGGDRPDRRKRRPMLSYRAFAPSPETLIDPEPRAEPVQRPQQGSLSSWYAESVRSGPATPEPFVPQPQDDSHLINDARPITDTGRVIAIEPARPEAPPVEIVE